LREAIVKVCPKYKKDGQIKNWPDYIDAAVFTDRVTTSSVTGFSPYFLLHSVEPLLPFDLAEATFIVEGFHSGMETSELLALRIRQLMRHPEDLEQAAAVFRESCFESCEQFLRRFKHQLLKEDYKPRELVPVHNTQLEMTVNWFKTTPRYFGPYEVDRQTCGGSYKLRELDGTPLKKNVVAFWLIPY
ncbi:hypothetical protein EDD85DRAFT_726655, partial [Armillaria nabsnona]